MSPTIEVRRHRDDELSTLIAVATRAFWDDPLFNFFSPDLLRQHRSMPGFFAAAVYDCARYGEVWTATIGETIVGVAMWLPPGVHPPTGGLRAVRQMRHATPTIARSPQRVTAIKLMNEITRHHPTEPHWYLEVLATDPKFQARGVGKALLAPILDRADTEGLSVYLETQKESNLAYYQRFRFEVGETLRVAGSPPVWTMIRQPHS